MIPHGTLAALYRDFDDGKRSHSLRAESLAEYSEWKIEARNKFEGLLGLSRMARALPEPLLHDRKKEADLTVEKWSIAVSPGVRMPFYLLMPKERDPSEKGPVVIAAHGHGGGGKETVAGRKEIPCLAASLEKYRYDYGAELARGGCVVACPDARGFGERRESGFDPDDEASVLGSDCASLNALASALGMSLAGMMTWDHMRLVDHLLRQSYCDPASLGACGFSGGGLQTLYLAACDERISRAMVSGYFYGFRDALLSVPHCPCNYTPGLFAALDSGDLAALIAPRPFLIETGAQDNLNGPSGLANVVSQVEIGAKAYRLLGAGEALEHFVYRGGHRWYGHEAARFFAGN